MKENSSLPNYKFELLGALVLFLGAFVPLFIVSLFNVVLMFVLKVNYQYNDLFLLISDVIIWVGAIFAFDKLICRPQTHKKLNFNFSTQHFSTYLLMFPMMFGMMLIAEFITSQIPITGPFFGEMYRFFSKMMTDLTKDTSVMILMAVIFAPIFEEIVFRGIIQKGLINNGVKPMNAIWISAFFFGLIHGNPWQFVGAVLLGFVLGLVYYKTKSLLMPILLHAFNNGLSAILLYYGNTESFNETFQVSEYLILGIGIAIFGVFYFLFMKKFGKENSEISL